MSLDLIGRFGLIQKQDFAIILEFMNLTHTVLPA